MESIQANNKRIAKNTLMLYIRMIAVMCVSIYTSRVYLDQLGMSDYGLYNVVGGIVAMFSFLNGSLSASTLRFLTFNLGAGNSQRLKQVFSASLNIHIVIGLIIVVLLETIGLWFVNNQLEVPHGRLYAVNWVYQFSVISCFLSIIQVPYNGIIKAHEDMGAFAWLSILDVLLKLLIAYLISIAHFDKLIYFGLLFLLVTVLMIVIYRLFCARHYKEAHFGLVWDKSLYLSMISFAGWNVFGGLAWMLKNHGSNILLNMFFGPVVNAARGIAMQVTLAVNGFCNSFLSAVFPQITKYYAQNRLSDMFLLVNRSLKFSYFIIFFLAFPVILNIDYVLALWLVKVPAKANIFIILVFIDMLIQSIMGEQLNTMVAATGRIRNFQIVGSFNMLLIIPISYMFLKLDFGPEIVFVIIVFSGVVSGFIRLYYAHVQTGYSYYSYLKDVMLPIMKFMLAVLPIPLLLKYTIFTHSTLRSFSLSTMITLIITAIVVYAIGLTSVERQTLYGVLRNKLKQK